MLAVQRAHRTQPAAGGKLAEGGCLVYCEMPSLPADVSEQWEINNGRIHIPVGKWESVR